jgi:branched-chain amino acid transport system substrate-binding protein
MGRYGVDQTGRQIRQVAITVQLQNGRKEIVAPKELMTAKAIWSKPAPTRQ